MFVLVALECSLPFHKVIVTNFYLIGEMRELPADEVVIWTVLAKPKT